VESTKENKSDSQSDGDGESEGEDEPVEGAVVEGSAREEEEEEVESDDVGPSGEEPGSEDEEPKGSAGLWHAQEQADAQASTESPSRGPPRSASASPASQLASKVENSLSVDSSKDKVIRNKAAIDAYKERTREKRKHHSRRGAERIGRAKGSKAKQDNRIRLDKSGLWD
jgi:RIO kinase 2